MKPETKMEKSHGAIVAGWILDHTKTKNSVRMLDLIMENFTPDDWAELKQFVKTGSFLLP